MRTLRQIQELLPTSAETGLSAPGVTASAQHFGVNRLTPLPREPIWRKFLEKFDEPIIKVLLAAALLSIVVDLFEQGQKSEGYTPSVVSGVAVGLAIAAVISAYVLKKTEWVPTILFASAVALGLVGILVVHHPAWDGLAVMVAVVVATGVAFLSEYRSDREFEALNARKDQIVAKVVRGGAFQTLPLEDVLVGDLVELEMGDEIPADGRLVKATDLFVDQSLMTGESEPVRKQPQPADGPPRSARVSDPAGGPEQPRSARVSDPADGPPRSARVSDPSDGPEQPRSARVSDPADGPEQPDCLYRGTQVVEGVGRMLVTEVGDATSLGQIARKLCDVEEDDARADRPEQRIHRKLTISKQSTPLQEKLEKLAKLISKVGYVAAIAIFLAMLIRGAIVGDIGWTDPGWLKSTSNLLGYFMYMVIIIVVAVPEGLPMSVTVSLALAMRKMTRAHSLVRQLAACETIGSATVICTDKTGTLTQNKMQVVRVGYDGQWFEGSLTDETFAAPSTDAWPFPGKPLHWIILNAAVNSTANLEKKDSKFLPVGNSTEGALLFWLDGGAWLKGGSIDYRQLRLQVPSLYQIHFSSERKRMTTVAQVNGRLVALVKGAAEWLLEVSTHYQTAGGAVKLWTPEARAAVQSQLRDATTQAMRTLAFGFKLLPPDQPSDDETLHALRDTLEQGLVFAGLVAIRDPLRDDVRDAIDQCRRAGLDVKMVTGDNVETARAIGREIGLLDKPEALVLTSPEFNALNDEQLKERLPRLRILARARPLDKFRLVKLLQELNEVVAVTGDGTNDAPALKKADVGLAMGIAGTEVAKEASKIVLLDDAFSTIVKAVHWGRALYENIQRFIQFQLTINVSALVIAFLGPFLGVKPPFTILQLLWINVIMDTFASIALCSEPPRPGLMNQLPKRRDESILTRAMLWNIGTTAAFFVVVMITLLLGMKHFAWFDGSGAKPDEFPELTVRQVSLFFTIYVLFQVWNEINCRSLVPEISGLSGLFRNPVFLSIAGLIVLGQILIVTFGCETVFKVEPLGVVDWLLIALGTSSVLVFAEAARRIRMALQRSTFAAL